MQIAESTSLSMKKKKKKKKNKEKLNNSFSLFKRFTNHMQPDSDLSLKEPSWKKKRHGKAIGEEQLCFECDDAVRLVRGRGGRAKGGRGTKHRLNSEIFKLSCNPLPFYTSS